MTSIREMIDACVERAMPGAKTQELRMGAMRSRWDGEDRDIMAGFVVLAEGADGLKVCWRGNVRSRFDATGYLKFDVALFWGHYGSAAETSYVERCDKIN